MKRDQILDLEFSKHLKKNKSLIVERWVQLVSSDPAVPTANRLGSPC